MLGEAEQGQLQASVCVSLILTHLAFTDTGNQKQSLTILLCTPLRKMPVHVPPLALVFHMWTEEVKSSDMMAENQIV